MRPLLMHVIHSLAVGGMENGLVNLINHLAEGDYGHVVVCIEDCTDFADRIRVPGVDVIALHRSRVGVGAIRRALYRLCRDLRPAIVHSRNQSGLDALLPAFLARVPVRVHGEHGWDVDNIHGQRWKPALLRRLHSPLVSRYVTVSQDLAQFLVQRVGIDAGRVTTICNGVDTDRFRPGQPPSALLPPHFAGDRYVRIGTVGRLQPVKDQKTLLIALAEVFQRRPDLRERARIVVVGDGPLRTELQTRAGALGLAEHVLFAGASSNVHEWLRTLDVFVLPSLNEGISNTLLEAMATGLPTLVTAVGGNVELVREDDCGGLFRPGDAGALASRLIAYLDSPMARRRDGAAARARCEERFSLRSMLSGYESLYRGLLQSRLN